MKLLLFGLVFAALMAADISAQVPQVFKNGFFGEREIASDDRHEYEVSLAKGQWLSFVVEQRGVDIVIRISTPEGKFVDRVDSPNGTAGEEPYSFFALEPTTLQIAIEKWSRTAPKGKYFVKPVSIRAATSDEVRYANLKAALLKIVEEDNRNDLNAEALERYFDKNSLITNSMGNTETAASLIEFAKQYTGPRPDLAGTNKIEISDAKLQEFGDVAVLSLYRFRHVIAPVLHIDRKGIQRIGYVFKKSNGVWRVIASQRTWVERDRDPIVLEAKQLEAFVGVYDGSKPSETMTVTRDGLTLYAKSPGDPERWELIPENERIFYGIRHAAFLKDKDGVVTGAVVYRRVPEDQMEVLRKVK